MKAAEAEVEKARLREEELQAKVKAKRDATAAKRLGVRLDNSKAGPPTI